MTTSLPSPSCICRDCEAAVSPAAYLVDLLDYTVRYVKRGGAAIDLPYLDATFLQRFSELPLVCGQVEASVPQVRIGVEVLRRFVGKSEERAEP